MLCERSFVFRKQHGLPEDFCVNLADSEPGGNKRV